MATTAGPADSADSEVGTCLIGGGKSAQAADAKLGDRQGAPTRPAWLG